MTSGHRTTKFPASQKKKITQDNMRDETDELLKLQRPWNAAKNPANTTDDQPAKTRAKMPCR